MLAKSHIPPTGARAPRPGDATLSVTKAAHVLGVHPNTIRAWSEAGRLRYYRINDRGDRRYRLVDLQRFLTAAASDTPAAIADAAQPGHLPRRLTDATDRTLTDSAAGVDLLADLAEIASFPSGMDNALDEACHRVRVATGAALVGIWELRPGGLVSRATDVEGPGITAGRNVPPGRSLFSQALESGEPIHARPGGDGPAPVLGMGTDELVVRIPGGERPWGVLVIAGAVELGRDDGHRLARAIARTLGVLIQGANATEQSSARLRRAEALRRVATDLASRLDVGDVVRDLSDHARVLFGADRVAVVLHDAEGRVSSPGGTGFSDGFLDAARALEVDRLGQRELPSRRPGDPRRAGHAALGQPAAGGRGPGGRRHAAVRAARRRPRDPRDALPRPRSAASLAPGRPRQRRGPRRRRRDRRPLGADVRADGDLGGAAPVDPAARVAAVRADRGPRDRPRDRDRAAAADRLPQRPRLPGPRQGPGRGRDDGRRRRVLRRDRREPAGRDRRGRHRLGREVPRPAARRRHGQRPARDHDPGLRARHRRVDAAGADGPRGRLPGRARAVQARAAPVHRGRPAAAGDLRVVRGPGDDQRRRDRPDARAGERDGAPAGGPARAAADHRVDPHDARPARGAGADHRPDGRADPVRQHRDRGRRPRRPACWSR